MSRIDFSIEERERLIESTKDEMFMSKPHKEQDKVYAKLMVLDTIHVEDVNGVNKDYLRYVKGLWNEYYNPPKEDHGEVVCGPNSSPVEDTSPKGHEIVAQCKLQGICKYFK